MNKYEIAVSESTRRRRKKLGKANLQYLRYGRFFVILSTAGEHCFPTEEEGHIRDVRRAPIRFAGYSIGYRQGGRTMAGEVDAKWHSHVEIERTTYKELRDYLLDLAVHRSTERLARGFYQLPFEPYAPVRRQFLRMQREVNRARKLAGFAPVPSEVLPLRRRVVRPFAKSTERRAVA